MNPCQAREVYDELLTAVRQLGTRAENVFSQVHLPDAPSAVATSFWSALNGGTDRFPNAEHAASWIVTYLLDPGVTGTSPFWRTALGRAVAWHLGYVAEEVPQSVAAAVLGITRQGVNDALRRGLLERRGDGVDRKALLERYRALYAVAHDLTEVSS